MILTSDIKQQLAENDDLFGNNSVSGSGRQKRFYDLKDQKFNKTLTVQENLKFPKYNHNPNIQSSLRLQQDFPFLSRNIIEQLNLNEYLNTKQYYFINPENLSDCNIVLYFQNDDFYILQAPPQAKYNFTRNFKLDYTRSTLKQIHEEMIRNIQPDVYLSNGKFYLAKFNENNQQIDIVSEFKQYQEDQPYILFYNQLEEMKEQQL